MTFILISFLRNWATWEEISSLSYSICFIYDYLMMIFMYWGFKILFYFKYILLMITIFSYVVIKVSINLSCWIAPFIILVTSSLHSFDTRNIVTKMQLIPCWRNDLPWWSLWSLQDSSSHNYLILQFILNHAFFFERTNR